MKILKYNRPLAWCVLIVIVIAAIPLGANLSVSRLEKKLIRIYEVDSDRYGSPKADLRRLADYGEQLGAIAAATTGEADAIHAAVADLRRLAQENPLRQRAAVDDLYGAASMAYNQIINRTDVPDSQRQSAISCFYEIDSTRTRLMNHKEYYAAAEKYNRAIRSFPGVLSARSSVDTYK